MVLEFNFEDQKIINQTENNQTDENYDYDQPKTVNFNPFVS